MTADPQKERICVFLKKENTLTYKVSNPEEEKLGKLVANQHEAQDGQMLPNNSQIE